MRLSCVEGLSNRCHQTVVARREAHAVGLDSDAMCSRRGRCATASPKSAVLVLVTGQNEGT